MLWYSNVIVIMEEYLYCTCTNRDFITSTNGYIPTIINSNSILTCRSINVNIWQVVSLRPLSWLIQPAPRPSHNGFTWLAWLAGSILVVGNDPELVAGSWLEGPDGEATPWLLDDGLPGCEPSLKHLHLVRQDMAPPIMVRGCPPHSGRCSCYTRYSWFLWFTRWTYM